MGILRRAALNIVRTLQQNFQTGFVHRAVAGQDRAQPRPAGPNPGLNETFRLP